MPDLFVPSVERTVESAGVNTPTSPTENHMHALASFCENPIGMSFQSQESDEKILLFLRRHFITNIPWVITTIILILTPSILNIAARMLSLDITLISPQFTRVVLLFYYLLVFAYAFVSFLTWFYNLFIATQKEIVDIDFSEIVFHDVAATKLNLVEDVNYIQSGFIRSLFNYGDLFVQTAGGKENIEAFAVPQPARAARIILDLIGHGGGSG